MRTLVCSLLMLVTCLPSVAEIGPTPGTLSVKPVFDKSDLVCKCFVRSLIAKSEPTQADGKPGARVQTTAEVLIQDSFKPREIGSGHVTIKYEEEDDQTGLRLRGSRLGLEEGETVLLFLTDSRAGYFEFADPYLSATMFHSFFQTPGAPGLIRLQRSLAATAAGSAYRDDRIMALRLLQGFDSFDQESLRFLNPLLDSHDPEVALPALGVLLKASAAGSVDRLRTYLDGYGGSIEPAAIISVGSELGRMEDPKSLGGMEALSASKFVVIRRGAMQALRAMKNPDAVATLASRLDDSDGYIRYIAVISLAETLGKNGDYAPSMYQFDHNPGYYLGLWKSWWATEGHAYRPGVGGPGF